MAALYLDSSALVKRYIREVGSVWVSGLTTSTAGNWLYVARIYLNCGSLQMDVWPRELLCLFRSSPPGRLRS